MSESWFTRLLKTKVLGAPLGAAAVFFVVGILFWGAYNTAMEATNTMEFCTSCHEMEQAVYPEYKQTVHYKNRSGVQAICSDCHVPDPWVHKFVRKIKASGELLHWALGSVDTVEKFEKKRLTLAKRVWKTMKDTDSRECRNCHHWDSMKEQKQRTRAWKQHQLAQQEGDTCIDCHKGIAHRPVHKLLTAEDDPYDGQPDDRHLPVVEDTTEPMKEWVASKAPAKKPAAPAPAPAMAEAAPAPAGADGSGVDWGSIEPTPVTLFFPGQASYEWVYEGSDHGGARALEKLEDRCQECHADEAAAMGQKMVSGSKVEEEKYVIEGKRPAIQMEVRAAHDDENLYMQFRWQDSEHHPAPFVDGGKMDPENKTKLAVMFDDGDVPHADHIGCWVTCHHDSRYMPDHPESPSGPAAERLDVADGITKYLAETRTEIEYRGLNNPRGGWDKLKPAEEIEKMKHAGTFMDLSRYLAGDGSAGAANSESGYVLAERHVHEAGQISYQGALKDGVWTVTMTRPLDIDKDGFVDFKPDGEYTVGFAIHDDYSFARFHHVSFEYKMGLDNPEAEINAAKQ